MYLKRLRTVTGSKAMKMRKKNNGLNPSRVKQGPLHRVRSAAAGNEMNATISARNEYHIQQ